MVKESNTNNYVTYAICAVIIIGLVAYLLMNSGPTEPETPEGILETIAYIEKLDNKHLTDWHEEKLGAYMIPSEEIDSYLENVTALREAIIAANATEANISVDFLDARIRMLNSQKYFQMALAGGQAGVFHKGFDCANKNQLLYYTNLYNQSAEEAQPFFPIMDKVLRKSKPAREVIGVNDEKPKFFETPIGNIKYLVDVNLYMVDVFCENKLDRNEARFEEFLKKEGITKEEFEVQIGVKK